tara:strand:- start:1031 stop:1204 length:174 start_codon:yes stop_codon:yes gene_type:complete
VGWPKYNFDLRASMGAPLAVALRNKVRWRASIKLLLPVSLAPPINVILGEKSIDKLE